MTDAGYVAEGYGVTAVAIGAYVAHLWARNRSLARAARTPSDDRAPAGPDVAPERR